MLWWWDKGSDFVQYFYQPIATPISASLQKPLHATGLHRLGSIFVTVRSPSRFFLRRARAGSSSIARVAAVVLVRSCRHERGDRSSAAVGWRRRPVLMDRRLRIPASSGLHIPASAPEPGIANSVPSRPRGRAEASWAVATHAVARAGASRAVATRAVAREVATRAPARAEASLAVGSRVVAIQAVATCTVLEVLPREII